MSEWKPIETAPKGEMKKQPPGSYMPWMWEAPLLILADPEYGVIAGYWWGNNDNCWLDRSHSLVLTPTHWMMAPSPPSDGHR